MSPLPRHGRFWELQTKGWVWEMNVFTPQMVGATRIEAALTEHYGGFRWFADPRRGLRILLPPDMQDDSDFEPATGAEAPALDAFRYVPCYVLDFAAVWALAGARAAFARGAREDSREMVRLALCADGTVSASVRLAADQPFATIRASTAALALSLALLQSVGLNPEAFCR